MPIVAITGQVSSKAIGTDAFQEADIRGITMPITKHNYLVTDAVGDPAGASPRRSTSPRRAAPDRCSSTSARTPCRARTTFSWPPQIDLPGYRPVTRPHSKQIREAARLIAAAKQPGPLRRRRRHPRRRQRRAAAARRADPDPGRDDADGAWRGPRQHPLNLGMPGMHGTVAAVTGPAEVRPAHHPRRPLRRPGHRPAVDVRARTPRSSTPTSTPPRSPRTASPTSRSSATRKEVIRDLIDAADRRGGRATPTTSEWRATTQEWKATFPLGYTD